MSDAGIARHGERDLVFLSDLGDERLLDAAESRRAVQVKRPLAVSRFAFPIGLLPEVDLPAGNYPAAYFDRIFVDRHIAAGTDFRPVLKAAIRDQVRLVGCLAVLPGLLLRTSSDGRPGKFSNGEGDGHKTGKHDCGKLKHRVDSLGRSCLVPVYSAGSQ